MHYPLQPILNTGFLNENFCGNLVEEVYFEKTSACLCSKSAYKLSYKFLNIFSLTKERWLGFFKQSFSVKFSSLKSKNPSPF